MAYSLYDASIPVFLHMLRNLDAILDKAEAHAKANGVDLQTYVDARLAPDMHPLTNQIQLASDAAKSGAARLAGVTPPSFPDTETTWPELKARIAKTIDFLEGVKREQVDGREDAVVELPLPGRTLSFSGRDFLARFAVPNFLFHVTTAYALLRAQGVPLGKLDFLNGAGAIAI
ncbi:MAG: DUF1993 family protein [Phenylobacterium sp.]|nr:DUF1993 family protein [Phenylobacterium sp.]